MMPGLTALGEFEVCHAFQLAEWAGLDRDLLTMHIDPPRPPFDGSAVWRVHVGPIVGEGRSVCRAYEALLTRLTGIIDARLARLSALEKSQ